MVRSLLTTSSLRQAYEFLSSVPPFSRWNLPHQEDVVFLVVQDRRHYGWCRKRKHEPFEIAISASLVGSVDTLMRVMAHEMIHLHQRSCRMETKGAQHNAAWYKLAEQVGKATGFDAKAL